MNVLVVVGLFLAGMLGGIEFIVRYGVHPALQAMPDRIHLVARHEIVRVVRVIVPAVMLPCVAVNGVMLGVTGVGEGLPYRVAAAAVYVGYLLIVFLGTVPINSRFFGWDPDAPPPDWKSVIARWAVIDIFRSSAAIVAFALLLVAALLG